MSAAGSVRRRAGRARLASLLLVLSASLFAGPASAQASQQAELTRLRAQRTALEREVNRLRANAKALKLTEATLKKKEQAAATQMTLLGRRINRLQSSVDSTTAALRRATGEVRSLRAAQRQHAVHLVLQGQSASLAAVGDRARLGDATTRAVTWRAVLRSDATRRSRAERTEGSLEAARHRLLAARDTIKRQRASTAESRRALVAQERVTTTRRQRAEQAAKSLERRITKLKSSERQLANAIAALEAARKRREAAAGGTKSRSTISTKDYGALDWPVQGTILYPFGREIRANNTAVRWNGIGIEAATSTPVRVVADGTVVRVGPLGTYGLTVIVEHGGGDYSIYGSLATARVESGAKVAQGAVLGTVGAADPDLPPHVHFEIRHKGPAIDPADWLRRRR